MQVKLVGMACQKVFKQGIYEVIKVKAKPCFILENLELLKVCITRAIF